MKKLYLTFLNSALLFLSTSIIQLNAQTLTIAQVYDYKVDDIICTQIDNGEELPNYRIDTITKTTVSSNSLTVIKKGIFLAFNFKTGIWEAEPSYDSAVYIGTDKAYFNKFLIKDSSHTDLDTNGNVLNHFEIKDSVFTDACGKQVNYSRYYSKKGSNVVLQIITVYEGLGTYFNYEQYQGQSTIFLKERPQFYISNGQFCGDSSVLRSFRNVSVSNLQSPRIQIWPNPFNDFIQLNIDSPYDYFISDYSGKMLVSGRNDSAVIETSMLCPGLYHLRLIINNQIFEYKVIKL